MILLCLGGGPNSDILEAGGETGTVWCDTVDEDDVSGGTERLGEESTVGEPVVGADIEQLNVACFI